MNPEFSSKLSPNHSKWQAGSTRPAAVGLIAALTFLIVAGVGAIFFTSLTKPSGNERITESAADTETPSNENIQSPITETGQEPRSPRRNRNSNGAPATHSVSKVPEPSAYSRELVSALLNGLDPAVQLTPERAGEWRKRFQALIDHGAAGVPAIGEFLEKNTDIKLSGGADQLIGYGSVRGAMIDALGQIGGTEAADVAVQTLHAATDPREVGRLAQVLERIDPNQYKDEAIQAARQMLALSTTGANKDQDIAAVFEVLRRYGGESVVADLEGASTKYGYYSAIALAQLPDGAGIPSIIRMLQSQENVGGDLKDPALRMLAQVSMQYPEAREALVNEARQNRIPASLWVALAPILAGEQIGFLDSGFSGGAPPAGTPELKTTHIAYGNQNFYSLPVTQTLTPEQMAQRLELIRQLVPATSDPSAAQALRASYDQLTQRLTQQSAPASGPQ